MAKQGYSNNAQTTIATTGGINSSATTFAPTSITGFPDATVEQFQIKVDSEIMTVTGYTAPNWTVTRGQEGTTAAAHAELAAVYNPLTKASLLALAIQSLAGTIVGARRQLNFLNTGNVAFTLTDDPTNLKMDIAASASVSAPKDEANWTAPVAANFSWVNQGGASVSAVNDALVLVAPPTSGFSARILKMSTPATPYTLTARFRLLKINSVGGSGFVWRQSSDGKLIRIAIESNALYVDKFTNETTSAGSNYISNLGLDANAPLRWIRMSDDGTNRKISLGADGVNWITIHSIGRTDYLTPDQIGFFADCGTNGVVNTLNCANILSSWALT
jgi:hypothetical protein